MSLFRRPYFLLRNRSFSGRPAHAQIVTHTSYQFSLQQLIISLESFSSKLATQHTFHFLPSPIVPSMKIAAEPPIPLLISTQEPPSPSPSSPLAPPPSKKGIMGLLSPWLTLAAASGLCAAFTGVFAKLFVFSSISTAKPAYGVVKANRGGSTSSTARLPN